MILLHKRLNDWKKNKILLAGLILSLVLGLIGIIMLVATDNVTSNESGENVVQEVEKLDNQEEVEELEESAIETKPEETPDPVPIELEWPVIYSSQQASSLTVVVNKKHRLPSDYVPSLKSVVGGQLRPEAADALTAMLSAAQNDGISMRIISSYRSYSTQVATYNKWVNIDGKAQADRSSARAGHSEHQTGLAVDLGTPDAVCDLAICFGDTAQGKWLALNAHNYGYIVRYESDTESVTGYQYEPWHMRYLGVDVAKAVKNSGLTLDQYYGVEAGGY